MFGSNVLDTAMGLVFVFLCVSLVCTATNELIAIAFASRARDLERGIRNMLDGSSEYPLRWWQFHKRSAASKREPGWADTFFEHQTINGTQKNNCVPSYIPSQDFVSVVLHLLDNPPAVTGVAASVNPLTGLSTFTEIRAAITRLPLTTKIRGLLLACLQEAESDLTSGVSAIRKFSRRMEIWFDHAMDRVGGWYKKRTQWVLLLIAVVVSGMMNIDTIAIYERLARDGTLRASLVAAAEKAVEYPTTAPTTQSVQTAIQNVKTSVNEFNQLGIPVGWTPANSRQVDFNKICGLLVTALAASLGAPFWFDVLNKFMSVRGTGKAPEEKPKDPKAVPQPETP